MKQYVTWEVNYRWLPKNHQTENESIHEFCNIGERIILIVLHYIIIQD